VDGTAEAWRERPHDDLMLAVAIAAWQGEHTQEYPTSRHRGLSGKVEAGDHPRRHGQR
jgi:hypothetical protein